MVKRNAAALLAFMWWNVTPYNTAGITIEKAKYCRIMVEKAKKKKNTAALIALMWWD